MKLLLTLQIILFFFLSSKFAISLISNATDRFALLAIKEQITSHPNGALASWSDSLHFCDWIGVSCGRRRRRVTGLNFSSYLSGTLSPYIGNLSFLRYIVLAHGEIQGAIPSEIGRLYRLRRLVLRFNSFSGEIPLSLTNCLSLEEMDLSMNIITGKIPSEIGRLYRLRRLDLSSNSFIGEIPLSLTNCLSLEEMDLGGNNITGKIPNQLGSLSRLKTLNLYFNQLTGSIPSSLGNLSSLTSLRLSYNNLNGTLPIELGHLKSLAIFQTKTSCQGSFQQILACSLICNLLMEIQITLEGTSQFLSLMRPSLKSFHCPHNEFRGFVPNFMGCKNKDGLLYLDLRSNKLGSGGTNDDMSQFIPSLANCSRNLERLALGHNQLSGGIPDEIGKLNLWLLHLTGNKIAGKIPPALCNIAPLEKLYLGNNQLVGAIPECLGDTLNLTELDLSQNKLFGGDMA